MVASGNAAQLRQAAIAFGRALGFTTVRPRARQNSIGGNLLTRRLLRAVAFCRVWTQSGLKIRCSKTW